MLKVIIGGKSASAASKANTFDCVATIPNTIQPTSKAAEHEKKVYETSLNRVLERARSLDW